MMPPAPTRRLVVPPARSPRTPEAAGAGPQRRGAPGEVPDDDRGRGARDAGDVVVLGGPVARVAEPLGVAGEVERAMQRLGRGAARKDGREVEDREGGRHASG